MSTTTASGPSTSVPSNRHALTPTERQKLQLEKLMKDPAKAAYVPAPPQPKAIRPAREMMKNVQGSSAGAGSGEFHVYKASRRREYERLKLMDEAVQKEAEAAEFERRRREADLLAEAKTAKNRAKRQKKKERTKSKITTKDSSKDEGQLVDDLPSQSPAKKRRLVSGKGLVFKKPGAESDDEEEETELQRNDEENTEERPSDSVSGVPNNIPAVVEPRIIIHEDD